MSDKTAAQPASVPTLFVIDTTCQPSPPYNEREHTIIVDGIERPVKFRYGEKTELPAPIALKFLRDEAFHVTTATGQRIRRVPDQPDPHATGRKPFVLEPDQVVARLDELTIEALLVRAAQEPDGEKLRKQDGKAKIIEFLIEARRRREAERRAARADDESDGGTEFFTPPADSLDEVGGVFGAVA